MDVDAALEQFPTSLTTRSPAGLRAVSRGVTQTRINITTIVRREIRLQYSRPPAQASLVIPTPTQMAPVVYRSMREHNARMISDLPREDLAVAFSVIPSRRWRAVGFSSAGAVECRCMTTL